MPAKESPLERYERNASTADRPKGVSPHAIFSAAVTGAADLPYFGPLVQPEGQEVDYAHLLPERLTYHLSQPLLDISRSASLHALYANEARLAAHGLTIPLELRLSLDGLAIAGVPAAGKTSTKSYLPQSRFSSFRMLTSRQPRRLATGEQEASDEYDFITAGQAAALIRQHFARRVAGLHTDLVAATFYAGNFYLLMLEEVYRVIELGKSFIFPWQREFAYVIGMIFPYATVVELMPQWGIRLIQWLLADYNLWSGEGPYSWIIRAADRITKRVFSQNDRKKPAGAYPLPRFGQTPKDYLWRLLYTLGSYEHIFRNVIELTPAPLVKAIRLMPYGVGEQIPFYDEAAAREFVQMTTMLDPRNSAISPFTDLLGKRELIAMALQYLHEGGRDTWASDHLRYRTSPTDWTRSYSLDNPTIWPGMAYANLSPLGTVGNWEQILDSIP